ncbi:MAG: S4 domain-containing protein [Acidobacteria bacterium]|nr:S4 domain-containing protein [Acidobacteriota bacterium]
MRLDLFLKNTHLLKKRSQAKKGIEFGKIKVNEKEAKPSYKIKINDIIEIDFETATVKFKVLEIAEKPIKKSDQAKYIEMISKERRDILE